VLGVTLVAPFAGKLPNPAMFTEVALVVVQDKTEGRPNLYSIRLSFEKELNDV
jgi:hypothetical protein